ncbi:hypothetical protein LCGC14_2488140, partial [marine sediment metagenome]
MVTPWWKAVGRLERKLFCLCGFEFHLRRSVRHVGSNPTLVVERLNGDMGSSPIL